MEQTTDEPERILTIKILGLDKKISIMRFREHVPFKHIMAKYCKRQNLPLGVYQFIIDFYRVCDWNTPFDIYLENGDTLEVIKKPPFIPYLDEECQTRL